MAGLKDRIYKQSPVIMQHAIVSGYGLYWNRLRFGGTFKQEYTGFLQREYYTADQWAAYVQQQLQQLLIHAYDHVPYYQQAWKGVVTRQQLEKFTVADMPHLPPLEKSAVRDDPQSFLVDGKPQSRHRINYTSGSSGTPIATYWLPEEMRCSLALREARSCRFAKVSYSMPRATFSGRMVEPDPDSKGPFYRFNIFEKQVYFSAFHLRPDTAKQYIHALTTHRIQWMTGYSNSIYQLAQMALDQKLKTPKLQAVITTSEKLTPEMREIIRTAFSTQVYEEYGTVENLFYACENEYGQKLVSPDCGLIELVDTNGRTVAGEEMGEVLATGFLRSGQPMIRYRIGDIAAYTQEMSQCGREMPVLKEVIGRIEDTIYGIDGRRMVRFHGIFVNQTHVQEGQIIQERIDHIRVLIVPKAGFGEDDKRDIENRIHQRLTDQMLVTVETVNHIERTKSGKFKAVICKLTQDEIKLALTGKMSSLENPSD